MTAAERMQSGLMRAHRALCTSFVEDSRFRAAFGASRADLGAIGRYLALPLLARPRLSLYFDRDFYLATNADVRDGGDDPLVHFIDAGFAELRSPHPLIDLKYLAAHDAALLDDPPSIDALVALLDEDRARPSVYFDMRDRGSAADGSLRHFLTSGLAAGERPNALLDPAWYAGAYPDVPTDPYGALRHFILLGDLEGRRSSPQFDGTLYRKRYPDVERSGVPPLFHYLLSGRDEGRQASADRAVPAVLVAAVQAADPAAIIAPAPTRAAYDDMQARVAAARQARKDAAVAAAKPLLPAARATASIARLRLPRADVPRVSVIVPVFNEFAHTLACLLSIPRAAAGVATEVILADDGSTDADVAQFADVPNLVYLRQPRNQGFIRTCNAAFARARGDYVLLLNNDTHLMPGAIVRLAAALDADPDVAAVGPRLVYPDGLLQEAGCYVLPSGETGMAGLFGDPDDPAYARARDVAYCSGAALMLRRARVTGPLFDEAYLPAYCEDVDLCLRLREAGHRVRYVHDAVVVHHLSASASRQSTTRKLRTVVRNQHTLAQRWGDRLRAMDRVRPIAFYLPQFHPTAENDFWWGAGFTEWTNVARARPSYAGHYQPHLPADLGFYDLRNAETMRSQAALAARYGVEGFCIYYYNFGSRRVLSRPLDLLRESPDIPFRYCLCWANENWTRHWDGGSREILLEQQYDEATLDAVLADAVSHAADPRALRVDDVPLFLVYRPLQLPDAPAFAARARRAFAAAGLGGVHLVYVESMEAVDRGVGPADLGFDAAVEFPPQGRAVPSTVPAQIVKPGWSGYRYDYPETALAFIDRPGVPYVRYSAVFATWDNTARQPLFGTSFDAASPAAFRVYVEEKIAEIRRLHMGDARLLFINAWNEWAEGAHLEPDLALGHAWLEALSDALDAAHGA